MKLSRFSRRIVAGVTGMMLLLYLSTGAANACILSAAGPHDVVMLEPCCESAAEISASSGPDCCQEHYLSQQATPAAAEFAALAAVELPMIAAHLDPPFFTECAIAAVALLPAHANPPPLHTLYCRLRN